MAKLDLASSEWCQLIFEGKNQAYGAYRMRANSTKRHNVAMLIVVVIAAVGFSIPTLLKLATPEQKEVMTEVTTLSKLEEPEIKQEEMKRVEPVAPPPPALKSSIKFTAPVIKKDEEVKFWDTNNQFTTRHRTNSSSVTMANYNGMPAVSFVPGRSGWAAELRSTANGKANTRISSRWHSEKDYNKVAGELYTGTAEVTTGNNDANASSDTHTRLKNAEHPSRPTALKFFYKYQPHNGGSDACSALIQLLDSNKEVIIENTISGGGTVSDWTEITLPLNYVSGALVQRPCLF